MSKLKQIRNVAIDADLKKLADAFFENLELTSRAFGIGLDCKRPFGNSSVPEDILNIIGWEKEGDDGSENCFASYQIDYAIDLYKEKLIPYLQQQWFNSAPSKIKELSIIQENYRRKANLAMSIIEELFESVNKPVLNFVNTLDYLYKKWKDEK